MIPDKHVGHSVETQKKYGVWRWDGMYKNKDRILPKLVEPIIDIGGAAAPLGFNSVIVDIEPKDINGNPVLYRSIQEIDFPVNTIFSSHTLEHFSNPVKHVERCYDLLQEGGYYIVHVPSVFNFSNHPVVKEGHFWIFTVDGCVEEFGMSSVIPLRLLVGNYFELEYISYVSDCSILAIGKKYRRG